MYSFASIKAAIDRPRAVLTHINRLYEHRFAVQTPPAHNPNGIDVLSADFDNLIILDACRFDTFNQCASDLPGDLIKIESRASTTSLFLRANFSDEELYDTVYVTANPQLYRIENGIYDTEPINVVFHDQIDVWQDQWHNEYRTVMPEVVTEAALEAAEQHPNKRLIIHYMRPHAPYIGDTGAEELPTEYLNFWGSFRDGKFDVSLETVKTAYRENLNLVLPHVRQLLSEFKGKTVVTADHGELLGDKDYPIPIRRYGHPPYTNIPSLLEVPWLIYKKDSRPDILSEIPEERPGSKNIESNVIKHRLKDLGYTQ